MRCRFHLTIYIIVLFSFLTDLNIVKMYTVGDSSSGSGGSIPGDQNGVASSTGGSNNRPCVLKGRVYTERQWYGYLLNKEFHRDYAKVNFQLSYPTRECCSNLLIYYDDQITQLTPDMTCEQRENILPKDNNQVIQLHTLNGTKGCSIRNESLTGEPHYVCDGERIFRSSGARTWFFALSRCHSNHSLTLSYSFNVTGYYGDCEEDPLDGGTHLPARPSGQKDYYLSLVLGIVAGVAVIVAGIFFALWFIARRRATTSKGSSVTSSQATMTQDDIFYVNPSLNDRSGHGNQEYGPAQSQAGSENYYEVIPEGRRSYESINHMLANGGPAGSHAHALLHHPHFGAHLHSHHGTLPRQLHLAGPGAQLKDSAFHRPAHPASVGGYPMFEDYPPPPYQPPRMLGGPRHNTLHHPSPHHHHSLSLNGPRPRPPILSPTHANSLSFPSSLIPQSSANNGSITPNGMHSFSGSSSSPSGNSLTALLLNNSSSGNLHGNNLLNNNSASGNNNSGNHGNNNSRHGNGITSNSPISMNAATNIVTLGGPSASDAHA